MLAHLSFQYQGVFFKHQEIGKQQHEMQNSWYQITIAINKHAAHITNQLLPSHFNKQTKQRPCKKPISNIFNS